MAQHRTHVWTSGMYWRNSCDMYILTLMILS